MNLCHLSRVCSHESECTQPNKWEENNSTISYHISYQTSPEIIMPPDCLQYTASRNLDQQV